MMWNGANIGVVDLGTNVSVEQFVASAKEHNAQIIGFSALLTTTMPDMKTTIDALKAAGMDSVKVRIGGAPITQAYADEIGAAGFSPDAASAVESVRKIVEA
jgi:5-methyltetrahydrofolate--homocysteine methyltransferase